MVKLANFRETGMGGATLGGEGDRQIMTNSIPDTGKIVFDTRRLDPGTQEGKLKIKVYRNFGERRDGTSKGVGACGIEGVHGGPLLGARGGFVAVWDWEKGNIVRRVDVKATT